MGDVLVEVVSRPVPGRPTVDCAPHAGSGAGGFRRWQPLLEPVADLQLSDRHTP